jgi:transposase
MTLFCTFTKKLIFDKKSKKGHSLTNQTKVFWLNVANTGFINCVNFIFRQKSKLYQWCENPKIPAENNYAEREVRKVVIARKISYGSQSETGAETREIWTSVLASLAKREANPRAKLVEGLNKLAEDENFDIAEFLFKIIPRLLASRVSFVAL